MQKQQTMKVLNESTLNLTSGGQGYNQYPNQFPFNVVNALEQSGVQNMNVSALNESILNLTR